MITRVEKDNWVHEYDSEYPTIKYELPDVRYVLGEIFNPSKAKSLICIGINPSTAVPEHLDKTLTQVQKYAKENGYDAWYMLNVYPQRATDPDNLPKDLNSEIHERNLDAIKKLFATIKDADVWCAWGGSITKRKYLKKCLKEIIDILERIYPKFQYLQKVAKDKSKQPKHHPMHPNPRSISAKSKLEAFDLAAYLKTL
ncbi:hypothetical protein FACS1894199_18550 [Bacteroidia bacterium]|nr:hypothetical protein FACS1894199_18550 [Bacteroidia bacterium]